MRRFCCSIAPTGLTALALYAFPQTAAAQPPQADEFEDGFYVWAAPAGGAVTFGDDDVDYLMDISYQTAVGGGYFIRRGNFMGAFGLTPELVVYNFDEPRHWDMGGVQFRALGDFKLGGGIDWLFIYGFLKPGLAVSHIEWDWDDCDGFGRNPHWWDCRDGGRYDTTSPGFNFGTGGGAVAKVYKGLGVGVETGVDLAWFFEDDHPDGIYMFDFLAYAGWWF